MTSAPTLGSHTWSRDLLALQANWDSYGAVPIRLEALETIGGFAVVPCADGGVQLEIHKDGYDIEIYVGPTGTITGVSTTS